MSVQNRLKQLEAKTTQSDTPGYDLSKLSTGQLLFLRDLNARKNAELTQPEKGELEKINKLLENTGRAGKP